MNKLIKKLHESKKNIFVIGDMLTGKTENVCKPYLDKVIDNGESFLVLDSKSEYIEEFYNKINENGYNKVILNIDDFDNTETFNILEYPYKLYKNGRVDDSINMLEKMFKDFYYEEQSSDPFWTNSAVSFIVGLILNLFENAKEEEINMSSVMNFLDNIGTLNQGEDALKTYFNLNSKNTMSYKYVNNTLFAPMDTREAIISVVKSRIKMLTYSDKIPYFLASTSFKLSDIVKKKTAIIIKTKNSMSYRTFIIPMIINQIYMYLLDSNKDRMFNFILDNFDNIEKIYDFNALLSDAPSNNIKFIIATRTQENLEHSYGRIYKNLSNQVYTRKTRIEATIDNEDFEVSEFEDRKKLTSEVSIEYPKLKMNEIKTYNFIENIVKETSSNYTDSKLEDVLNEIDDEINNL